MLCDAVVNVLDIENRGRLRDWREHNPRGRLQLAPLSFWVMITAYHIGDIDLIKRFLFDVSFMKQITESKFGCLTLCLCIAARQGHKEVLLFVMNNYLTDVHYDKHRILYEACMTGQAECARLLKFALRLEVGEDYLPIGRPDGAQGWSITVIGRLSNIRYAHRPMRFRFKYPRDCTSIFVPNARPSGRCSENVTASRLGSVEGRSKVKLN